MMAFKTSTSGNADVSLRRNAASSERQQAIDLPRIERKLAMPVSIATPVRNATEFAVTAVTKRRRTGEASRMPTI